MSESKRKIYTGAQIAKVALEAVIGTKTINEIIQEHGVQYIPSSPVNGRRNCGIMPAVCLKPNPRG